MESLDLSVCLRPVWARALRCDGEGLTGVAPQEGPVGATIVGQNPLDRDAEFGEPFHSAMQHPDGRDGGLVVMYLGVRNARGVVDDRVHEGVPALRVAPLALRLVGGGRAVVSPFGATDVRSPAACRR